MIDEQGIIFDIDHFAVHDGPGIRTVIYLKGCPLKCLWCHSPESQTKEPEPLFIAERCKHCSECKGEHCPHEARITSGKKVSAAEIVNEVMNDKVFFDTSGGGVTLSGGEVLFQGKFAQALLAGFHANGIHTVVETAGMGSWETLAALAPYTDIFYYDIKILDTEKHAAYTGAGNAVIVENLRKLAAITPERTITLRVPLIPGYTDGEENIVAIYNLASALCIRDIHLLRYNASAPAKYQWLGAQYRPGSLQRQSDTYMETLCAMAPKELNVTVF